MRIFLLIPPALRGETLQWVNLIPGAGVSVVYCKKVLADSLFCTTNRQ